MDTDFKLKLSAAKVEFPGNCNQVHVVCILEVYYISFL